MTEKIKLLTEKERLLAAMDEVEQLPKSKLIGLLESLQTDRATSTSPYTLLSETLLFPILIRLVKQLPDEDDGK